MPSTTTTWAGFRTSVADIRANLVLLSCPCGKRGRARGLYSSRRGHVRASLTRNANSPCLGTSGNSVRRSRNSRTNTPATTPGRMTPANTRGERQAQRRPPAARVQCGGEGGQRQASLHDGPHQRQSPRIARDRRPLQPVLAVDRGDRTRDQRPARRQQACGRKSSRPEPRSGPAAGQTAARNRRTRQPGPRPRQPRPPRDATPAAQRSQSRETRAAPRPRQDGVAQPGSGQHHRAGGDPEQGTQDAGSISPLRAPARKVSAGDSARYAPTRRAGRLEKCSDCRSCPNAAEAIALGNRERKLERIDRIQAEIAAEQRARPDRFRRLDVFQIETR